MDDSYSAKEDLMLRLMLSRLVRKLLFKLAVYVLDDVPVVGKLVRIAAYAC